MRERKHGAVGTCDRCGRSVLRRYIAEDGTHSAMMVYGTHRAPCGGIVTPLWPGAIEGATSWVCTTCGRTMRRNVRLGISWCPKCRLASLPRSRSPSDRFTISPPGPPMD